MALRHLLGFSRCSPGNPQPLPQQVHPWSLSLLHSLPLYFVSWCHCEAWTHTAHSHGVTDCVSGSNPWPHTVLVGRSDFSRCIHAQTGCLGVQPEATQGSRGHRQQSQHLRWPQGLNSWPGTRWAGGSALCSQHWHGASGLIASFCPPAGLFSEVIQQGHLS